MHRDTQTNKNRIKKYVRFIFIYFGPLVLLPRQRPTSSAWDARGVWSSEQFVIQSDHKRAEPTDRHEVAAEDVDPARLYARPLLAGPAEQQRESPRRHLPHALEGVEEDVGSVLRQVQAADVETGWKPNRERELVKEILRTVVNSTKFNFDIWIPGLPLCFWSSR